MRSLKTVAVAAGLLALLSACASEYQKMMRESAQSGYARMAAEHEKDNIITDSRGRAIKGRRHQQWDVFEGSFSTITHRFSRQQITVLSSGTYESVTGDKYTGRFKFLPNDAGGDFKKLFNQGNYIFVGLHQRPNGTASKGIYVALNTSPRADLGFLPAREDYLFKMEQDYQQQVRNYEFELAEERRKKQEFRQGMSMLGSMVGGLAATAYASKSGLGVDYSSRIGAATARSLSGDVSGLDELSDIANELKEINAERAAQLKKDIEASQKASYVSPYQQQKLAEAAALNGGTTLVGQHELPQHSDPLTSNTARGELGGGKFCPVGYVYVHPCPPGASCAVRGGYCRRLSNDPTLPERVPPTDGGNGGNQVAGGSGPRGMAGPSGMGVPGAAGQPGNPAGAYGGGSQQNPLAQNNTGNPQGPGTTGPDLPNASKKPDTSGSCSYEITTSLKKGKAGSTKEATRNGQTVKITSNVPITGSYGYCRTLNDLGFNRINRIGDGSGEFIHGNKEKKTYPFEWGVLVGDGGTARVGQAPGENCIVITESNLGGTTRPAYIFAYRIKPGESQDHEGNPLDTPNAGQWKWTFLYDNGGQPVFDSGKRGAPLTRGCDGR
jgi:hypothetical protein